MKENSTSPTLLKAVCVGWLYTNRIGAFFRDQRTEGQHKEVLSRKDFCSDQPFIYMQFWKNSPISFSQMASFPRHIARHAGKVYHWGYKWIPPTWSLLLSDYSMFYLILRTDLSPMPGLFSLWRWLLNSMYLRYISWVRSISIPKWDTHMLSQSHISPILYTFKVLCRNHHIWPVQ